jgi:hypothetical protein
MLPQVQQHKIKFAQLQAMTGASDVSSRLDMHPMSLEIVMQFLARVTVVIDHQNESASQCLPSWL